jgi:hypothetical protein
MAGMARLRTQTRTPAMTDNVTIILNRELSEKMTRPWYLIKKREADIIREAFNNALKGTDND